MAYESEKSDPVQIQITNIYSLFLHCNSLYILCFYCHSNHYVILIAFKKQNKKPKKNRPVQNTSIILNELLNKHVVYYFKNSVH